MGHRLPEPDDPGRDVGQVVGVVVSGYPGIPAARTRRHPDGHPDGQRMVLDCFNGFWSRDNRAGQIGGNSLPDRLTVLMGLQEKPGRDALEGRRHLLEGTGQVQSVAGPDRADGLKLLSGLDQAHGIDGKEIRGDVPAQQSDKQGLEKPGGDGEVIRVPGKTADPAVSMNRLRVGRYPVQVQPNPGHLPVDGNPGLFEKGR